MCTFLLTSKLKEQIHEIYEFHLWLSDMSQSVCVCECLFRNEEGVSHVSTSVEESNVKWMERYRNRGNYFSTMSYVRPGLSGVRVNSNAYAIASCATMFSVCFVEKIIFNI